MSYWNPRESQQEEYFRRQNNKEKWGDAGGPIDAILLHPIRFIKRVGPIILVILVVGVIANMCDGNAKKTTTSTHNPPSSTHTRYMLVNSDALNVRSGPSADYGMIGQLKKNTRVQVLDSSGQWWKIKSGNIEGFVNSSFLIDEKKASSTSSTSSSVSSFLCIKTISYREKEEA